MPNSAKIATIAGALLLVGLAAKAEPQQVQINVWPQDVPCDAIRKNPDGSWTQVRPILLQGNVRLEVSTYRNSGETRLWDRKCGGAI